ncbi:RcnB family protein [Comamonas kerstersii]|uniref:RcnB family protein n=1 Tax=Comamonas kerstersii TaxID=225992 RepID=UPI0026DC14C9|nr:RcnB family protein [Comamonas kerstersii]
MNPNKITAALAAFVLGSTSLMVSAQPMPPGHGGPGGPGRGPAAVKSAHPGGKAPGHAPNAYRPAPNMAGKPMHPHGMPPGQAKRMGAGPQYNWVKGSRVPPQYRTPHYVVNDWRGHGLKAPPRGHQWVQYGADYMLVAIATGVIAQLILGH